MLQRESPETRQPLHSYRDVSSEHRQHPTAQTTATRIASFQFLAALTLASCSLAPPPELPQPETEMPEDFARSPAPGPYQPLQWWKAFGDPALDWVVDSVLESNLDMAVAVARVEQARERARIAKAAVLPVVQGRAGINDLSTPTNAGFGGQIQELGLGDLAPGFSLPERLGITTYSVGADFSYEMDFWSRVRSDALAAGAEYLASESDYQAARIGILAETIRTYFEIADLRQQIDLTSEMVDVLLERENVASTRYDRGLSDSLDLYRVRQDLRNTQADLPKLQNLLASAEARLATLLGGYRTDLDAILPDTLSPPDATGPVPVGIPTDLLFQRPDVRAVGLRLEAARAGLSGRPAAQQRHIGRDPLPGGCRRVRTDRSDGRQRSRGGPGRTAERGSETLAARLAASRG